MNRIIYIVGLVVIVLFILRFFGTSLSADILVPKKLEIKT
jgi:hypothetical protein